jgi:hypothetical protein
MYLIKNFWCILTKFWSIVFIGLSTMNQMTTLEKKQTHNKLFPQAYIAFNQITFIPLKKSRFMIWVILALLLVCFGLFTWFQSSLIDEASTLGEMIR